MAAKIIALILALGVGAVLMLNLRQERLQVLHETAELQKRLAQHDRDFLSLRTRIASSVSPPLVQQMAAGLGPTVSIAAAGDGPAHVESPAATDAKPGAGVGKSVLVGLPAKKPASPKAERAGPPHASQPSPR